MNDTSGEIVTKPSPDLEPATPEVKRYQRQKILVSLASTVLSLAVLAAFALIVGPNLERTLPHWVGAGAWLQLLLVAVLLGGTLEAVSFPFDFYAGFVLEHRHGLSNMSLAKWLWKKVKGWLVGGAIGLPLLFGLYALLWYSGGWWWLWATAGWLLVTLLMGRLMPILILPLFYKVTRLENDDIERRLEHLAQGTGLKIEGVYRLHLSAETKKANAALTGLGKSRRVLLGDTLLEEFTPEEIEVVFAHEVGHHVYKHIPKMMVWGIVVAVAGFWLADVTLHAASRALGYSAFNAPAALPLFLLVLSLFGLALAPLNNIVSRFFERQCDRYALDHTGNREAYVSAFTKLAKKNKADPDPHPLVVWLFYDHPPIRKRLALAEE